MQPEDLKDDLQPGESQVVQENEGERIIRSRPKVIYKGGSCDHFYMDYDTDDEGFVNARCTKCPMGIRYLSDEKELIDGKCVTKRKHSPKTG